MGLLLLSSNANEKVKLPYRPTTEYYDNLVDHYASDGFSATYKQKYIIDANHWDPINGVILFYAGHEGEIDNFYKNTGFVTEYLSKELKGLVVFGEHRFFGESWPFPEKKDLLKDPDVNRYLTVEQAMMDYVKLIKYIRYKYNAM